jgi:hypothetical protein
MQDLQKIMIEINAVATRVHVYLKSTNDDLGIEFEKSLSQFQVIFLDSIYVTRVLFQRKTLSKAEQRPLIDFFVKKWNFLYDAIKELRSIADDTSFILKQNRIYDIVQLFERETQVLQRMLHKFSK